jgi:hypothetical protein
MALMRITRNGGAVSDGLPYNAFIVDGRTLVEAPPDAMLSHLHGDGAHGARRRGRCRG